MKNERLDRLLNKICHGQTPLGCGQTYAEPAITEQLGRNGFDLIWLDQEHTSCTIEQIRLQIQMSELTGMVSFVRVADHLPSTVKPVLEMAPDGVIFPMVNTRQEAELVRSARTATGQSRLTSMCGILTSASGGSCRSSISARSKIWRRSSQ